jgi:hypothetical protein
MTLWKQVYARQSGDRADIVMELGMISDPDAKLSIPLLLAPNGEGESVQKALSAVYDDPAVTELSIYTLGDAAAMSGLLIAGRRKTGETTFLIFLLD